MSLGRTDLCLVLWLLLCLCGAVPAYADRDIVYAARYYTPPGSHRTSHFHLYRINPDGTGRTQLTYGDEDDSDPHWSPDGRWIVYDQLVNWQLDDIFLIHVSGGRPLKLLSRKHELGDSSNFAWSPDCRTIAVFSPQALLLIDRKTRAVRRMPGVQDFVWSPDGQRAYITVGDSWSGPGSKAEILAIRTGAHVTIPGFDATTWTVGHSAIWQGNKYLLGDARGSKPGRVTLSVSDLVGHIVRKVTCRWSPGTSDPGADSTDLGAAALLPGPVGQPWNLWVEDNSISSWQDSLYSRVETRTGELSPFAEGQFLVFSPNGRWFCLSPHRQVVDYAHGRDGTERGVWGTPLQVGSVKRRRIKTITPGIVWVTGADWRRAGP
jgi:hypothetical protein